MLYVVIIFRIIGLRYNFVLQDELLKLVVEQFFLSVIENSVYFFNKDVNMFKFVALFLIIR